MAAPAGLQVADQEVEKQVNNLMENKMIHKIISEASSKFNRSQSWQLAFLSRNEQKEHEEFNKCSMCFFIQTEVKKL